jgi:hypothetical protein
MEVKRWPYPLLLAGGLVLLAVGLVLADPSATYGLDWWTVDSGGGALSGGDYALEGTAGQPDAGVLGGGSYELSGGFWTTVKYAIHLPLILETRCFPGPDEREDNDGTGQAFGALCDGAVIVGSPKNDAGNEEDWFYVDWGGSGTLTVDVTSFGTQAGVFVYRNSTANLVGFEQDQGDGSYHVECTSASCGGAGRYYIRLFVDASVKASAPDNYQLTVAVP